MVDFLRRYPIRARLLLIGALPLALSAVVALVAVLGFSGSVSASASAAESSAKAKDALAMKYQAADWNGWQTAYAYDVMRGVKGAYEDTADSRKAFLASGAEVTRKLDLLKANTDAVIARGGFGSPTFFVGGDDMYFGNDRMPLVRAAVLRRRMA